MNTSQIESSQTSTGEVHSGNRRALVLELAQLIGERSVVQDRLTWLDRKISETRDELKNSRDELKNFDQVGV